MRLPMLQLKFKKRRGFLSAVAAFLRSTSGGIRRHARQVDDAGSPRRPLMAPQGMFEISGGYYYQ